MPVSRRETPTHAGAMIRYERRKKGLHLADVAQRVGVSTATVSRWERGREPMPFERREEVAETLGIDPARLGDPAPVELTTRDLVAGPLAPLLAALRQVTAERDEARELAYELKLAAAGGEDVPGSANLVTAEDVRRWRDEDARQLATANAELARLRAEVAARQAEDEALMLSNDGELEADPQKQIAHLQLSCREFIREREEWKASAKREWAVVERLRAEVEAKDRALKAKAEEQVAYWRKRQQAEKCLEDGVSEDGLTYTPIGDEAAWQGGYCNGRMSEADWWLKTLQYWPQEAARAATAREG